MTASSGVLQMNNDQLEQTILEKDEELATLTSEFHKLKSIVKYKSEVRIPAVNIAFEKPMFKDSLTDNDNFVRQGHEISDWYRFNYKVTNDSLILSSLTIPTETTIITGFKRQWFLGKQTLTTEIINTNPYISISEMRSAEIRVPEPVYKKWYIWLAAGLISGAVLAN